MLWRSVGGVCGSDVLIGQLSQVVTSIRSMKHVRHPNKDNSKTFALKLKN